MWKTTPEIKDLCDDLGKLVELASSYASTNGDHMPDKFTVSHAVGFDDAATMRNDPSEAAEKLSDGWFAPPPLPSVSLSL